MTLILYFAMYIANGLLFLCHKKSRVIALLSFLIICLIYSGNMRDNFSDIRAYRQLYESASNLKNGTFEMGYSLVADFFSNVNIPFNVFLLLLFLGCSLLLVYSAHEIPIDFHCLLFLFSSFYLFYVMETIRFFIAESIIIGGVFFLFKGEKWKYCICVVVATLFHKLSILFILFIFVNDKQEKFVEHYKKLGIMVFSFCLIVFSAGNQIPFLPELYGLLLGEWKTGYIFDHTRFGFLYYFIYYIFTVLLNLLCRRTILTTLRFRSTQELLNAKKFSMICLQCNLIISVTLPLIMISTTFFRFSFVCTLLTFVLVAVTSSTCCKAVPGRMVYTNRELNNFTGWTFIILLLWSAFWWYLNINQCTLFEALAFNILG